jgi:hypothetical protein
MFALFIAVVLSKFMMVMNCKRRPMFQFYIINLLCLHIAYEHVMKAFLSVDNFVGHVVFISN